MKKRQLPYPLKIASHALKLPDYISYFIDKHKQTDAHIDRLTSTVDALQKDIDDLKVISDAAGRLGDRIADLQHQLHNASFINKSSTNQTQTVINDTVADNHRYAESYKKFEDRFRGSEDDISERLKEHLPLFTNLPPKLKKQPIVDIGCGRGELLGILAKNKLRPVGIDMNESMIKRAKDAGHEAHATDAYSYLAKRKSSSLAAITGFHIVEHIPFESLMEIFNEAYRTIDHGGFALFETPNPESLTVGAHTFYLDPSHQRPIPPQLLAFMLEYCGFSTEILYLHPIKDPTIKAINKNVDDLMRSVYGYADYAVLAKKI